VLAQAILVSDRPGEKGKESLINWFIRDPLRSWRGGVQKPALKRGDQSERVRRRRSVKGRGVGAFASQVSLVRREDRILAARWTRCAPLGGGLLGDASGLGGNLRKKENPYKGCPRPLVKKK